MTTPLSVLQHTFGYQSFRPPQDEIIDSLLQGEDVFVLMPTGGGKSLCYQIPALLRQGTAIVVSPLIALMEDQVATLKQLGVSCAYLNSTLEPAQQQEIIRHLRQGEYDLLYIAPERLLMQSTLNLLQQMEIALFAIDEAHCVSQWGHDFRKEYQRLRVIHEMFPEVPRIALTATADERTREEIIQQLDLGQAKTFISSFDRPNIRYTIGEGQNAQAQLWRFIQSEHAEDAGIVYCLSRKRVESVAEWLSQKGRIALPYHAGMPDSQRRENQRRFLREEGVIIVATIAFGMGIDKPNVRFVAHMNLPKNIEAYYQETGRAGRDGAPANAWMAYSLQDVIMLRQMMQESDADATFQRVSHHKLEAMLAFCELTTCRRQALLAYFGEHLAEPCGNCDICLSPPETWDATLEAQKALSCIYRTGQQFGVNYLVDVLLGKEDQRILANRHNQISTYGLGKDLSAVEWRNIYRQLIARGFINVDMDGYGALRLAEKSRTLLRGEQVLHLRKNKARPVAEKKERKVRISKLRSYEQALFEDLKALRKELADFYNVPPYVIFHDSSLEEMTRKRPQNKAQFAAIAGVGEQKLEKYASDFLKCIAKHDLPNLLINNLSDSVNETLYLYAKGKSVAEIAKQRELSESTIYGHLAEAIEMGLLSAEQVLALNKDELDHIMYEIEMQETLESGKLKPVYEALDGAYASGVLRCALAAIP